MAPRAWLVSELTTPEALARNEQNRVAPYHAPQMDELIHAVGRALRDVKFHRHGTASAIVYRDGDTHALGEIGYKDTRAKGSGEKTFFVMSRRIKNEKYREGNWQYNIVSTKSLPNATKAAATHLVPYTCEEVVEETRRVVQSIIKDSVNELNSAARSAFKTFTGEAGYATNMTSELMLELRTHTFISPRLNEAAAAYYSAYDTWREAEALAQGSIYYVGISDNYGQKVLDMAQVQIFYPYRSTCFNRIPAESAADWVRGRVAVLNMAPPQHYVQGVGLRLDDRVFYIVGEDDAK